MVLANRLSADPKISVCVIEAGKPDRNPLIHIPFGLAAIVRFKSLDWGYNTVPQKELNSRRLYWPRGKVLGGSSSINAMCYIRGAAENYDEWETSWRGRLELEVRSSPFLASENNQRGASDFHGAKGPLPVSDNPDPNLLSRVFVEAGTQLQLPHNPDFNGESQGRRPLSDHNAEWPPRLHLRRLSTPGGEPPEPDPHHRRHGAAHPVRRQTRLRRRDSVRLGKRKSSPRVKSSSAAAR